jgi:peroxiredoxin
MAWGAGVGAWAAAEVRAAEVGTSVESRLDEVDLRDADGKRVTWKSLEGQRATAAVFVGSECPLVRLYLPRLAELQREFARQGIALVGVDANAQDSAEEIASLARDHQLPFPVIQDVDGKLADALGAERTPEVVVLDAQQVVRYRGRIDDQFAIGAQRAAPTREDLREALSALASGKSVERPQTEVTGCRIGRRVESAGEGEVTYNGQIATILNKQCAECHRAGDIGPFALTNYDDAAAWAETLVEAVDGGRMPPWFADPRYGKFLHQRSMADEEKTLLRQWVAAGCPEGTGTAPTEIANGVTSDWKPNVVYPMSAKPFEVPASGVVDYQYFTVDPKWQEDRWLSRLEAIPGERSVVHHILVFLQKPGRRYTPIYPGELVGGYVPGKRDAGLPPGYGVHVPAGSKLVLQIHYTPNGIASEDLSQVAIEFRDANEIEQVAASGRAINVMFHIPPGAADHEVSASYLFRRDKMLLKLIPHMHVRGKSIRYEAIYPDGTRETLLDIPRWDFNWQMEYALAEPKRMPAGTELICTGVFDNSTGNPSNPDPEAWVEFGEQTWDEMLIGFFVAAEPRQRVPGTLVVAGSEAVQGVAREFGIKDSSPAARAERLARHVSGLLEVGREVGILSQVGELGEIEHIVLGGIQQAKSEGVLDAKGRVNREALGQGAQMMRHFASVLKRLSNEGPPQEGAAPATGAASPAEKVAKPKAAPLQEQEL